MKHIELLAPAGSMDTLIAAVNGGANAVYLGGKSFGARRSAQNFSDEAIAEAIKYCHERNVSVYVTVNTLIKDAELEDALLFISFLYLNDVDAVILQDIGLLDLVKQYFPDLHCHASTQMTFHDLSGVKQAKLMGFDRIVLSRELTFEEIRDISNQVDIEIEFFVHGALCISYSGQCLMSSYIGGRSGNRGACAQPCRKQYIVKNTTSGEESSKSFVMSPKDMMTYSQIEALKSLNNVSLKIEGRMKSADYVYSIVSNYRDGLDHGYDKDKVINFSRTFNRQFTTGFMFNDPYSQMMNYEIPSSYGLPVATVANIQEGELELKLLDTLTKGDEIQYRKNGETVGTRADVILLKNQRVATAQKEDVIKVPFKYQIPKGALMYKTYDKSFIDEMLRSSQVQRPIFSVRFEFFAKIGEKAKLKAQFGDDDNQYFEYSSESIVELAINKPLDETRIIEQLSKLGGTQYFVAHVKCQIEENMTIPISEVNRLRRLCIEAHIATLSVRYKSRQVQNKIKVSHIVKHVTANVLKVQFVFNQVELLLKFLNTQKKETHSHRNFVIEYYLSDINGFAANFEKLTLNHVKPLMPRIIRNEAHDNITLFFEKYADLTKTTVGLSHIGQIPFVKNIQAPLEADYSFNIMNSISGDYLNKLGFNQVIWSTELSKEELKKVELSIENNGVFAYGHLPLMISEYCPVGGAFVGHDHCNLCVKNQFSLVDERQLMYPLSLNPSLCRAEIMSDMPLMLLDQVPQLIKSGFNVFRIAMDSFDNQAQSIFDTFQNVTNLNEIDKVFPFNPASHSRGNFNRGIE